MKYAMFDAMQANRIRNRLKKTLFIPRNMCKEGVNPAPVDIMKLVPKIMTLKLKPDYTLVALHKMQENGGKGYVFALPEGKQLPNEIIEKDFLDSKQDLLFCLDANNLPVCCLDAFEGNETPRSYLEASILKRELCEFGAKDEYVTWGHHQILGSNPFEKKTENEKLFKAKDDWELQSPLPDYWCPEVNIDSDGSAVVSFHTLENNGADTIFSHTDTFKAGSYSPKSTSLLVARHQTAGIE